MLFKSKSRKAEKPIPMGDAALRPAVILVGTRLPENVGMTARAMLNCGLMDLRLVNPAFDFPDQKAFDASSGADQVLRDCRVFSSIPDAIADLTLIYATSARGHHLNVPVHDPCSAAKEIIVTQKSGNKVGLMFGTERTGLENEDVARANRILTIPLQKNFNSLNLSQAVLLVGYQIFLELSAQNPDMKSKMGEGREVVSAEREELDAFLNRLIPLLDETEFFYPIEKRPTMMDNVRVMFTRMGLTSTELKTLHGIVTALMKKKPD